MDRVSPLALRPSLLKPPEKSNASNVKHNASLHLVCECPPWQVGNRFELVVDEQLRKHEEEAEHVDAYTKRHERKKFAKQSSSSRFAFTWYLLYHIMVHRVEPDAMCFYSEI